MKRHIVVSALSLCGAVYAGWRLSAQPEWFWPMLLLGAINMFNIGLSVMAMVDDWRRT